MQLVLTQDARGLDVILEGWYIHAAMQSPAIVVGLPALLQGLADWPFPPDGLGRGGWHVMLGSLGKATFGSLKLVRRPHDTLNPRSRIPETLPPKSSQEALNPKP